MTVAVLVASRLEGTRGGDRLDLCSSGFVIGAHEGALAQTSLKGRGVEVKSKKQVNTALQR